MDRVQDLIEKLPKPLRNKYLILLVLFILWIVFLDDYNLINQNKMKNKVNDLKDQKEFYLTEITNDSTELSKLRNDTNEQEKFAREKFLMKKDNEDIFIIRDKRNE
ncbi:septum formation initiator family protein [Flavobacteriales bacterium]|jgi:cell division protein DivIC|nr:septum formation initiator family protein [Flavobacteriales bacterium]MBT4881261.1 septum formation initiator family protein [Flavobacteriales bacterium]MDC3305555.1 septum formation initiator family protein [Flavobacteriales bacterium]MDG1348335.1 septum formation initiator family protein [Flavobacteriales bacterium]